MGWYCSFCAAWFVTGTSKRKTKQNTRDTSISRNSEHFQNSFRTLDLFCQLIFMFKMEWFQNTFRTLYSVKPFLRHSVKLEKTFGMFVGTLLRTLGVSESWKCSELRLMNVSQDWADAPECTSQWVAQFTRSMPPSPKRSLRRRRRWCPSWRPFRWSWRSWGAAGGSACTWTASSTTCCFEGVVPGLLFL